MENYNKIPVIFALVVFMSTSVLIAISSTKDMEFSNPIIAYAGVR